MEQTAPDPRLPGDLKGLLKNNWFRTLIVVLIPLFLLLFYIGPRMLQVQSGPTKLGVVPVDPAIEEIWGFRVSQVAVTADGGMLDFRFVVTNPDVAADVAYEPQEPPLIVVEGQNPPLEITPSSMVSHKRDLTAGQTYFLLYANVNGKVKTGSYVTIKFRGQQLQHIPVW